MNAEPVLRRRFLCVDGRRVHYLRLGSGPPAVLVHSSPTNAWYVLPQMRLLAERYTCFAFDTPGFGLSESLPGAELSVADLAQALADNMGAAGLPACPVFGTHTGAAIALSLGAHHPERVTALVLDGLPAFTAEEQARIFAGYFEPLAPDDGGGHYARTWTRFRDQYTWFPWTQKRPERHNESNLGNSAALHAWTMSFFHAGRSYMPAYRAACHYGAQALADVQALACPAVFTATERDMLYPHLDRLPPLKAGQTVRRVGNDNAAIDALIEEMFARWPAQRAAPPSTAAAPASAAAAEAQAAAADGRIEQQFIDVGDGQWLLRHAGAADAPPLLLLHDAPGSGARHTALMQQLALRHRVLAPDLPGCGGSTPLAAESPAGTPLAHYADGLAALCTASGDVARAERVCVYGIGCGASLALEFADRHPALVGAVVVRGVLLPDAEERRGLRERYAPPITLQPDGSHWYRTWLMLRDQLVWFPWYDARAACLRRVPSDFGANALHDWTFEVMKQHASYHQLIDAALRHDAAACLRRLRAPLALCPDPQVPFDAHRSRLLALRPEAPALPPDAGEHAAALARFLAQAGGALERLPETTP